MKVHEHAMQESGPQFDLRDEILKNGAMLRPLLERVVNAYIAAKKGAA